MKNHIVAPSVVDKNLYLKPGRWGWNPVPDAARVGVSPHATYIEKVRIDLPCGPAAIVKGCKEEAAGSARTSAEGALGRSAPHFGYLT